MEQYADYKKIIDEALANVKLKEKPKRLFDPVAYTLSLGGKRLRPVLALAACDLFGGKTNHALNAAIGIEIFHNFTLLHDDIMDRSSLRRGKETVHRKWNSNVAILSGDTMFAIATKYMNEINHQQRQKILDIFTDTAIEVCEGQQYDMDFEDEPMVQIPEYLNMIRLKTAVLLGASLQIGALTGNTDYVQSQLLYDFGVNVGMAFQLKDDYLDTFGDREKFGKQIGGDIRANKKTYLFLKCLEKANDADRRKLLELYLDKPKVKDDQKVKSVLYLFEKYNVKNLSIKEMENYFSKALELMKQVKAPKNKKDKLVSYAEWLYKRDK